MFQVVSEYYNLRENAIKSLLFYFKNGFLEGNTEHVTIADNVLRLPVCFV